MYAEFHPLNNLDITILVRGEVNVEGSLRVHSGGSVLGRIRARSVLVEGVVDGFISAKRVEIASQGVVKGRIEADWLIIRPGGQFKGVCRIGSLDKMNQSKSETEITEPLELRPDVTTNNWFWKKQK
jgi:cytoskeletal protein CcmA (bactofilin family)